MPVGFCSARFFFWNLTAHRQSFKNRFLSTCTHTEITGLFKYYEEWVYHHNVRMSFNSVRFFFSCGPVLLCASCYLIILDNWFGWQIRVLKSCWKHNIIYITRFYEWIFRCGIRSLQARFMFTFTTKTHTHKMMIKADDEKLSWELRVVCLLYMRCGRIFKLFIIYHPHIECMYAFRSFTVHPFGWFFTTFADIFTQCNDRIGWETWIPVERKLHGTAELRKMRKAFWNL